MNENEIFDHLIDDSSNDDLSNVHENDFESVEHDDLSNEVEDSEQEETSNEDILSIFLKENGISNPSKIQFEGDDGTIEELNFASLDKKEQLNILKEITNPGLSNHEVDVINYLRRNQVSFDEVVDYFSNQKLQEYLKNNPDSVPFRSYAIDEYTDDELYLADLKSKYPSFTDGELLSKLDSAKADENLFNKEVNALREQYIAEEDRARQEAEFAEQQEYEDLKNNLIQATTTFSEIALDTTDPQSDSLIIEDADRNQILGYLLNQDANGKSQFVKDIEDPKMLVELAWYRINGRDTLSGVTQYWKNILREERNERNKLEKQLEKYKNKEDRTVIRNIGTTDSPSSNLDFWDKSGLI